MPASRAPKRSSGPLRVGVLGQGRSGLSIHCKWFEQSPRKFKIVAIADLLAHRRRQAVERFGCACAKNPPPGVWRSWMR